jgi:hypothetical protein
MIAISKITILINTGFQSTILINKKGGEKMVGEGKCEGCGGGTAF